MTPSEELKRSLGILPPEGEQENYSDEESEPLIPREEAVFEIEERPSKVVTDPEEIDDVADDYKFTRNVLYSLVKLQGEALANAMRLVRESEHPRAFSTFSEMASSLRETTLAITELNKTFKTVTKDKPQPAKAESSGNKLTGSMDEILELLERAENERKQNEID